MEAGPHLTKRDCDRIQAVMDELSDVIFNSLETTLEQVANQLHRIDDEMLLPLMADIANRAEGLTA